MHIGIVLWNLYNVRGGIERFGIDLSAEMIRRGHRVTIFYAEPKSSGGLPQYAVPPGATCIALPGRRRSPTMIDEMRARIVASDIDVLTVLFSWHMVLRFPVALKGTGIPLLLSEHSAPWVVENLWNADERRACLEAADRIHTLSESFRKGFPAHLNNRIEAIPHPVRKTGISPVRQDEVGMKTLLAVGRFDEYEKQFALLIRAFASIARQFPDWNLTLCGDGQDREMYEQLVASLNLHDRIFMPGMVDDVDAYYERSHLFCIPSRYEGFGLVTVEAQNYGLPVVGFAECSGTNEIIEHGKNGVLAAEMTAESLVQSLSLLMGDPDRRRRLGHCGQEMLARYDATTLYDRWEGLLEETANAKGDTQLQRILGKGAEEVAARKKLSELLANPALLRGKSRLDKIKDRIRAVLTTGKAS